MWLLAAALLGAGTGVLPAVAVSESSTTVNALAPYSWSPRLDAVKPGDAVTFQNASGIDHGIIWRSTVEPECSAEVPVGAGHFSPSWKGTCTFAKEGVYAYECSYHMALMRGTVYVNATGTVPSEPPPTTPTTPTTTQTTPAGSGAPSTTSSTPAGSPPASGALGSPFAGSASAAIELPVSQRGTSVHGSVAISQIGAGGKLTVELLARHAALAGAGGIPGAHRDVGPDTRLAGSVEVVVGRSSRASLRAVRVPFAVALDANARRSLRRTRRLPLRVRIALAPLTGAAVVVYRSVVLRP
jgi:plastocyanin